jgi:iron complex transport system substrate-binding protein
MMHLTARPGRAPYLALAAAAVTAAVALAGCASTATTPASTGSSPPASTAARSSFPVTLTASDGRVTIKARPDRIVSLAATATEDLYAVGAGSQVVAVDQDSDYPSGVPVTKLSGVTPNLEAIAKY